MEKPPFKDNDEIYFFFVAKLVYFWLKQKNKYISERRKQNINTLNDGENKSHYIRFKAITNV